MAKLANAKAATEKIIDLLKNKVGEAVGHASVCWEKPEGAGIFQSEEASKVVDTLLDDIYNILSNSAEN